MAKGRGTLPPSAAPTVSLSTSVRSVARRPGFPLPKPTESYRKVLREVEGTDDSLIRLIPNRRVCVFRQIEYVEQRLSNVLRRRVINKKSRDTRLNLIDEPADG